MINNFKNNLMSFSKNYINDALVEALDCGQVSEDEPKTSLYLIYNDVNNKSYIGITRRTLESRFKDHCSDSKSSELKLHVAMREIGVDKFHIELLGEVPSSLAPSLEKELIFNNFTYFPDLGYNDRIELQYSEFKDSQIQLNKERKDFIKISRNLPGMFSRIYLFNRENGSFVCRLDSFDLCEKYLDYSEPEMIRLISDLDRNGFFDRDSKYLKVPIKEYTVEFK